MGLWKAIKRGVGKAAEKVGEKLHIESLKNWGREVQERNQEMSKRTGETREYDQYSATVDQTARVADILTGFSSGLYGEGRAIEASAKALIDNYFNVLHNAMEGVLGQEQAVKNLITQQRLVMAGIDGTFNEVLSQRVSLSDRECLDILKLPSGSEKERKMSEFGSKVISEGLAKLSDKLKQAIDEIRSSMESELGDLLTKQKLHLEELSNHLNDLLEKRQGDAHSSEEAMLKPAQKLAASEIALELIQGGYSA